ncbi:hypothetical protein DDV98_27765 [Streptomyces sp. IB2014 011-12]|nr:hypothetical protein DDV98_27765 [Streptomyces sp. IB2014 011-12]
MRAKNIRIPSDGLPTESALDQVRDAKPGRPSVDRLKGLHHVLAGQLHDERDHPRLVQPHDLFEVAPTDTAIAVPGVPAAQDHLLDTGQ